MALIVRVGVLISMSWPPPNHPQLPVESFLPPATLSQLVAVKENLFPVNLPVKINGKNVIHDF